MTEETMQEVLPTISPAPSEPLAPLPETTPTDDSGAEADLRSGDEGPVESLVQEADEGDGDPSPTSTAGSPASPEDSTGLRTWMEGQKEDLAALRQAFDDKIAIDHHKEKQIELLHRELQEHKRGLIARAQRPLLIGMVRFHDSLGREAEALSAEGTEAMTPDRVREILEGFQGDVEILLEDQGVQLFRVAEPSFDPHRQTVLQGVPTDDETQTGRLARRVRPGFELDGTVLQKERVEVFTAQSAPDKRGNHHE